MGGRGRRALGAPPGGVRLHVRAGGARSRAEDPHAVAELEGEPLCERTRHALAVEAAKGARAPAAGRARRAQWRAPPQQCRRAEWRISRRVREALHGGGRTSTASWIAPLTCSRPSPATRRAVGEAVRAHRPARRLRPPGRKPRKSSGAASRGERAHVRRGDLSVEQATPGRQSGR
eukprot:3586092-Prymnesium_polylepis.2